MHKNPKTIFIFVLFFSLLSLSACSLSSSSSESDEAQGEKTPNSLKEVLESDDSNTKSDSRNSLFFADFEKSKAGFSLEDSTKGSGKIALVNKDGRNVLELSNSGQAIESHKIQAKKLGIAFLQSMTYNGSIWMKGEGDGKVYISVERAVSPWDSIGLWKEFSITNQWKKYDLGFEAKKIASPNDIKLSVQMGAYSGKLWIDDLEFVKR